MKSQIGTSYNLSKQYNFYCTNLTVDKLENFSYGLPNNAIIISSPTDRDSYDIGTPSILMTDYNSNIMPLTYTLDKSQFERVGKTNKIKFRESIIDTKFTTYYNLLKRIENNVNLKHKAVSYFYYDIYDYYNDISTYYDGVSDYYDTISYYYNEIVEKYDDIIKTIKDVKGELEYKINSLKDATKNALNNAIDNLKITYIMPIYNMTDALNTRITNLEKLHENDITNNTNNEIINSFVGIRDGLGQNSDFQITILPFPPTGGNHPTQTLPPGQWPGGSGGNGSQTGTRPPSGGGITQSPTHQQQKPGWAQGLPTS